jgi:hypothetical protein
MAQYMQADSVSNAIEFGVAAQGGCHAPRAEIEAVCIGMRGIAVTNHFCGAEIEDWRANRQKCPCLSIGPYWIFGELLKREM